MMVGKKDGRGGERKKKKGINKRQWCDENTVEI